MKDRAKTALFRFVKYDNFSLTIDNLAFESGKIYCITGPNGAGKSTLLKVIGLAAKPLQGSVAYDGRRVEHDDYQAVLRCKRRISFLLQNSYLFRATVFDNVAYGLKIRKIDRRQIRDRVWKMMQDLQIDHLADKSIAHLSGGEAQRVKLARNLALDAQLYILDEPYSNLDIAGRQLLTDVLSSFHRDGKRAIIFTTHYKEEAYGLAPRILQVANGGIVGLPRENILRGAARACGDKLYRFCNPQIREIYFASERHIAADVGIAIDPDDILVATGKVVTSARNCLEGEIIAIQDGDSSLALTVQAGEKFTVLLTKSACSELDLRVGSQVYLIFKATAVKIVES